MVASSSSSPLYAYPVNINLSSFVTVKLTSTSYRSWETQILALIESQDLRGFIDGETPAPEELVPSPDGKEQIKNPNYKLWVKTDRLVKAWITASLTEEVLGVVIGLKSAADVWTALADAFAPDSQAREFELLLKLQLSRKGMRSLAEYLKDFKLVCDKFSAIGKAVPDQSKVFYLLTGLGPKYEMFTTTMLKPLVPSYADIIPLLQSHELRNKNHQEEAANDTAVLYSQRSPGSKSFKKGIGFSLQKGKAFINFRERILPDQHRHSLKNNTEQNMQQYPQKNNGNTLVCQVCRKRGHEAMKCWHRFDNSYQPDDVPEALATVQINDSQDNEWFPDTRANARITNNSGSEDKGGSSHGN